MRTTRLFLNQRCVEDKQYLKGYCGVTKLHFAEELVTLDGISWSASSLRFQKYELESGSHHQNVAKN